jgi:hypothetical protein
MDSDWLIARSRLSASSALAPVRLMTMPSAWSITARLVSA